MSRDLESDLWHARHTICELAPDQFRRPLMRLFGASSWDDVGNRTRELVDMVCEAAVPTDADGRRAACPLCRSMGTSGWTPQGLRQHLNGSHRAQPCRVVEAAEKNAGRRIIDDERRLRESANAR